MVLQGSPDWQRYLFYAATLFLLWEVWRGWRLGLVRGLLRLAALFFAWMGGSAAAGATGTMASFFSKVPPLFAPVVAGLCVGLGIYIGVSLLAGLLFKTTQNHSGVIRWGFGLGGAVCGIFYGLIVLSASITLIRGLGALGELRLAQAHLEGRSPSTEQKALLLIKLRKSLELGVTGQRLQGVDPLPTSFYDNMVKISIVMGNPQSMDRFVRYPGVEKLLCNPHMAALVRDPAFEKAAESRNFLPLIRNKNVQAVANDPQVVVLFKEINLGEALDFALSRQGNPGNIQVKASASPRSPRAQPHAKNFTSKPSVTPSSPTN
jgi:hypothetical protein